MSKNAEVKTFDQVHEAKRIALIEQDIEMHAETDETAPVDEALRNSPKF